MINGRTMRVRLSRGSGWTQTALLQTGKARQVLPREVRGGKFLPCRADELRRKPFISNQLSAGPALARHCASLAAVGTTDASTYARGLVMSWSVNGSGVNNPWAYWQTLTQPSQTQSGAAGQSDPLQALLTALGQQTQGANSGPATAPSSSGTTGSSSPQFSPQTLQALFQMQANASDGASQADSADDSGNAGQVQEAQQGHGHHHHHGAGLESLLAMLDASTSGATSQTTTSSNGSSIITIDYSDGSSIAMTTPASTTSSSSSSSTGMSDNSSSSGAAAIGGNNLLEQLIAMQAQLLNTTTPQSIATV
jgi:hypothetical protein